jgi:hypothetical protein
MVQYQTQEVNERQKAAKSVSASDCVVQSESRRNEAGG